MNPDQWLTVIVAVVVAIVGSVSGFIGIYQSWWIERKKRQYIEEFKILEMLWKKLLNPLLNEIYRMEARNDVDEKSRDDIRKTLRDGSALFVYCPANLKKNLLSLYSSIEKGELSKIDTKLKIVKKLIEELLLSMKTTLEVDK